MNGADDQYMQIILDAIRVCAEYRPKFGQGARGGGLTLEQFQELYQRDSFYNWFGLDNPMMYTAHKAAGGITSVYRQIGIGCEKLFRRVVKDAFDLSEEDVTWWYRVTLPSGQQRTLHLDGRVPLQTESVTETNGVVSASGCATQRNCWTLTERYSRV